MRRSADPIRICSHRMERINPVCHIACERVKIPEQMPEEVVALLMEDILRMQAEVEAQATALGADGQTSDDGEAGFVDKDDVGTQPRSVSFTRGQSRRFHCSMRCLSRSMARRASITSADPLGRATAGSADR